MAASAARILVVHADGTPRATLAAALQRRGYLVTLAATGADAIRWLVLAPFDLLLVDPAILRNCRNDVAHLVQQRQPGLAVILYGSQPCDRPVSDLLPNVHVYEPMITQLRAVLKVVATVLARQQEQLYQQVRWHRQPPGQPVPPPTIDAAAPVHWQRQPSPLLRHAPPYLPKQRRSTHG